MLHDSQILESVQHSKRIRVKASLFLVQCLRSDAALLWSSAPAASLSSSSSIPHKRPGMASGRLPKAIRPEDTRAALCDALRLLMGARLVARPSRKHALLPAV